MRAAIALAVLVLLATVVGAFAALPWPSTIELADLVQAVEAVVNELILLGIAIFFLAGLETRLKRRDALRSLHQLRSIAHIVDMHQLTKDPEHLRSPESATPSSPARSLTRFELARYLDYCSELLSITSKLAALHVQHLRDPVVLAAVNDVESLTVGLSGKIWQKIMVLDAVPQEDAPGATV